LPVLLNSSSSGQIGLALPVKGMFKKAFPGFPVAGGREGNPLVFRNQVLFEELKIILLV
jgi:hypothetical protein